MPEMPPAWSAGPLPSSKAVRERARILHVAGEAPDPRQVRAGVRASSSTRLDDGAGGYALAEAALGERVDLQVEPEGALPFVDSLVLDQPETVHDIELGPRRQLIGTVVDALSGRPVAGASVRALMPLGRIEVATSDAAGRIVCVAQGPLAQPLQIGGSGVFLEAQAPGYLSSEAWLGLLARGQTIALVPTGRIEGRVHDAAGQPAAGATVAWRSPVRAMDARFGPLALERAPEAMADASGAFVLDGVLWGVEDSAVHVQHGTSERWVLQVAPEDPCVPRVLEIRMPRGRALQGRVVWTEFLRNRLGPSAVLDGQAQPLPAPRVTVRVTDAEGHEHARTPTDALGRFELDELPSGRLQVEVDGHPESGERVEAEHAPEPLELRLLPPLRELTGSLRAHDGAPLVQHEVTARLRASSAEPNGVLFGDRTDAEGAFALAVPAFAERTPVLSVAVGWTKLEHEAAGARFDWTLPELVPVALELGAEEDGAFLAAWQGPGALESGRTDRVGRALAGRLELELPAGELVLTLTHVEPEPRRTRSATIRVERGSPERPARIPLPR